jgi:hypothetical protein
MGQERSPSRWPLPPDVPAAPDSPVPAAPTPRTLYVHDDLSGPVGRRHGPHSPAARRARELLEAVGGDGGRVVVLDLEHQLAGLVAQGPHPPFAIAVGIGRAGEGVTRHLHVRAGWFPAIRRVEVAREEDGRGGYALSTLGAGSLERQLEPVGSAASIAVIDDTIFSGLTMRAVLDALPPGALARTHAFCLRAVGETMASLAGLCPIVAGFAAPGRLLEDVSFINASGLVTRGAIRRAGQTPLAFWERPEWMRAWFGERAAEISARCRVLHALLAPV